MLKPTKDKKKPNFQRRLVVQGTMLSAAALAVPGVSKAICGAGEHAVAKSDVVHGFNSVLTTDAVSIELIESKVALNNSALARVTVTNNCDRAIKLKHLSPGTIATQSGVYQINATLRGSPIAIRPNGVYQFWLEKDDGTQAKLSQKPAHSKNEVLTPTMLEVSVVTETEFGKWVGTQRVQALIA